MNTKARRLEEEYEITCTMRKVGQQFIFNGCSQRANSLGASANGALAFFLSRYMIKWSISL